MVPRRSWNLCLGLSLALSGLAACEASKSATTPTPTPTAVRYTALGASDAVGYGASQPCLPWAACPTGTGYVPTVTRRLDAQHADFDATNLGVPGAVLSRRLMDLGNSLGRGIVSNFVEGQLPFVPRNTTVLTLFTGGNDVNTLGAAIRAGRAGANPATFIEAEVAAFGQEFRALVEGTIARSTSPLLVVLNLPNLARLPYTAGLSSTDREWLRRLSVGISATMNAVAGPRVLVVDLMCQPAVYQASHYSSDGFHPNDAGYAMLADLVTAALATPPGPPAASCAFMQ